MKLHPPNRAALLGLLIGQLTIFVALIEAPSAEAAQQVARNATKVEQQANYSSYSVKNATIRSPRLVANATARSGRSIGGNDGVASDDDQHFDPQTTDRPVLNRGVSREGAMQMRRAARNAERKMSLVHRRLGQIQAQIAQDHSGPVDGAVNEPAPQDAGEQRPSVQDSESHSSQVIRSYVPGALSSAQNYSAPTSGGSQSELPTPSSETTSLTDSLAAPSDTQVTQAETSQNETEPSASSNNRYSSGATTEFRPSQLAVDNQLAESAARVSSADLSDSASTWSADESQQHQYFNEMNAKNHNQSPASSLSNPFAASQQQASRDWTASERFKNMTVVNSPTDLVNSYSTQQPAGSGTSLDETQPQKPQKSRSAPIKTYQVPYGKSSKTAGEASSRQSAVVVGQQQQAEYSRNSDQRQQFSSSPLEADGRADSYRNSNSDQQQPAQNQLVDRPMTVSSNRLAFAAPHASNSNRQRSSFSQHFSTPVGDNSALGYVNMSDHLRHRSSHSNDDTSNVVASLPPPSGQTSAISNEMPHLGPAEQNNDPAQPSMDNYQTDFNRQLPQTNRDASQQPAAQNEQIYTTTNNNYNNALYNSPPDGAGGQEWPQNAAPASFADQLGASGSNSIDTYGNNERVDHQPQYYYLPRNQQSSDSGQILLDSMQPAATNSQNYAQQQQYAALYPTGGSAEMSSLIRRYQQQQQLLANQDNLVAANYREPDSSVRRYYVPSQLDSSYLPQQRQSNAQEADYYLPQPVASQQGQTYFYSPQSLSSNSIRSSSDLSAFYRALAAATRAPEWSNSGLQRPQVARPSAYGAPTSKQSPAAGLYAAAAMNTPIFYEAPAGQARSSAQDQQQQQQSLLGSFSTQSGSSSNQRESQAKQSTGSPEVKRSYSMSSLFKPTASSRYFYAPGYGTFAAGSPLTLATSPVAAYQSAYAGQPTDPTALQSSIWQQLYAAALAKQYYGSLPGGAYAAALASPTTAASTTIDHSQQYQGLAQSGLQPTHYMAPDTEMAESTLVPTSGSGFVDPSTGLSHLFSASSGYAGGTPTFGQFAGNSAGLAQDSSASSHDDSSSSSSSTAAASESKGKGVTPWTNIAGLLLGILPFGILMASLLPAVTVTGRKKRELEIGGRNFSELLKWRPPSTILNALMSAPVQQQQQDPGSLASLIGELWSQWFSGGGAPEEQERSSRRRSLVLPAARGFGRRAKNSSSSQVPDAAAASNGTSEAQAGQQQSVANSNATAEANKVVVKSKVKKALGALSEFISAAQNNMKRKHRSSIIDSQWLVSPLSSLKSSLKLDQLFNMTEFKRQLASAIQARALAAQNQIIQQQQQQVQQIQNLLSRANMTLKPAGVRPPSAALQRQAVGQKEAPQVGQVTATTTTTATTSKPNNGSSLVVKQTDGDPTSSTTQATAPLAATSSSASIANAILEAPSKSRVEASLIVADRPEKIQQQQQRRETTSRPNLGAKEPNLIHYEANLIDTSTSANNSTRHHLENAPVASIKTSSTTTNETTNSSLTEQQLERITKRYINKLVEQIEAEHPSVSLSVNRVNHEKSSLVGTQHVQDSALDVLYKHAMRDQCSQTYRCLELVLLEEMLSKMKLKFS